MNIFAIFSSIQRNKSETDLSNEKSKYKGFSMDLFDNISAILEFNYNIIVMDKSADIGKEDPKEGWNGIVKELMLFHADFAISDIVISEERKRVIDFSISFQTLGKLWSFFIFSNWN